MFIVGILKLGLGMSMLGMVGDGKLFIFGIDGIVGDMFMFGIFIFGQLPQPGAPIILGALGIVGTFDQLNG